MFCKGVSGRITPAYAGKSGYTESAFLITWDHPRLCGEKFALIVLPLIVTGSPPPMRGKVCGCTGLRVPERITPAYAGKSVRHISYRTETPDHPRLCGEKCPLDNPPHLAAGSPPPMRGKVPQIQKESEVKGITPAYAGKSLSSVFC